MCFPLSFGFIAGYISVQQVKTKVWLIKKAGFKILSQVKSICLVQLRWTSIFKGLTAQKRLWLKQIRPFRGRHQQHPVSEERTPVHHEGHVGHLLAVQETNIWGQRPTCNPSVVVPWQRGGVTWRRRCVTQLCGQSDVHGWDGRNGTAAVTVRKHRRQPLGHHVVLQRNNRTLKLQNIWRDSNPEDAQLAWICLCVPELQLRG